MSMILCAHCEALVNSDDYPGHWIGDDYYCPICYDDLTEGRDTDIDTDYRALFGIVYGKYVGLV